MKRAGRWFFLFAVILAVVALWPLPVFAVDEAVLSPAPDSSLSTPVAGSGQATVPIPVEPQPVELPAAPVRVTGYQLLSDGLSFVQLYNKSSDLVSLQGWQLIVANETEESPIALEGYLLPHRYMVVGRAGSVTNPDSQFVPVMPLAAPATTLVLVPTDEYASDVITTSAPDGGWLSLSQTAAGNYTSTSKFKAADGDPLYGGGRYTYSDSTPFRVVEMLTNPRDCGPLEASDACISYVKLCNTASDPVDASAYRLRTGYANQAAGIANTITLSGTIPAGGYVTVRARNDGAPLALASSGGNVWVEDAEGIKTYAESVVQYEGLGDAAHKGLAWALDTTGSQDSWRWAVPTLTGPNEFPAAAVPQAAAVVPASIPAPCPQGQYRNPETHRCRHIMIATSSGLIPCKADQYRSPETNRCRTLAAAITAFSPCTAGQVRNPATGRCKRLASTAETTLKPCASNQERNPDTNRCRAVTASAAIPKAAFAVEPIADTGTAFVGWWALGGVTLLGVGYGAWEWRAEALRGVKKAAQFFASLK